MNLKKEFIEIYNKNIHRAGADKLLEYLISKNSDFLRLRQAHGFTEIMIADLWYIA